MAKEKTVEEILKEYDDMHGKPFKDRIKKFEEFQDPDIAHQDRIAFHAEYTIMGKPSDRKSYPGAYEEAYKVLDSAAAKDTDKVSDIDQLTNMLEKYVDVFLQKAMGEKFKEAMEKAKADGLSEEDIRKMKGNLFQNYHIDPETGKSLNILDESYIKKLKGKKKIELLKHLRGVAEQSKKMYATFLNLKATEHLIEPTDIADLHEYTTPKFEKAGFEHSDHPLTRKALDLANDYATLLSGRDLSEREYKRIKEKK